MCRSAVTAADRSISTVSSVETASSFPVAVVRFVDLSRTLDNQDLEGALKKVTSDACRLRAECAGLREDVDVLVAQRDALRCELYGRYGPCVQSQPQSVLVLLASDSEDSDVEEGTDDGSEGRSKRLCCRAG